MTNVRALDETTPPGDVSLPSTMMGLAVPAAARLTLVHRPLRAAGQSRGTSEGLLKADVRAEALRSILRTKLTVGSDLLEQSGLTHRCRR